MMRISGAALVAALLACGPSADTSPAGRDPSTVPGSKAMNHPPEIASAVISPADPSIEDLLQVLLDVRDAERDTLDVTVTWLRNGVAYRSGPDTFLPAESFGPGDSISARVSVTDGEFEDSSETDPVMIRNLPPRITLLRLQPEPVSAAESIVADIEVHEPEEEGVTHRFRWLRNGVAISGAEGPVLEPGKVRRGDRVQVAVIPVDDRGNEGNEVMSNVVRVVNSPPEITSEPPFTLAGPDRYEYAIQAHDPDGDYPLRYELVRGPQGMKIDLASGRLVWNLSGQATGNHDIEVVVRDAFGGEARQSYAVKVGLELPPAAAE